MNLPVKGHKVKESTVTGSTAPGALLRGLLLATNPGFIRSRIRVVESDNCDGFQILLAGKELCCHLALGNSALFQRAGTILRHLPLLLPHAIAKALGVKLAGAGWRTANNEPQDSAA